MSCRALVFCGDCWHPAETVRHGLAPLTAAGFAFEFCEGGAKWPVTKLADFPLVVLAKANMISATDQRAWLTPESESLFQDFLRQGNGLLMLHAGTARYGDLPAMRAMTGGTFVSHPDKCPVTLEPKTGHPLTAGVAPFTVQDEPYFMSLEDARAEVFLRSRSEHGVQPAGWTRVEGEGRVGVLTPGHDLEVWRHPSFQKLLLNALCWTARLN